MTGRVREEVCRILGIAPARFGFVAASGNLQPHSAQVVSVFDGGMIVGYVKLARSGSGKFYLRRECLVTRWLESAYPESGAVTPPVPLESAPLGGLLYVDAGRPVGQTEAKAWLARFQRVTGRVAESGAVRRATVTWKASSSLLPESLSVACAEARGLLMDAAGEERVSVVVRHGDVAPGNVLDSGMAIDWVHFRKCSLPEYDLLYLALAEYGVLSVGPSEPDGLPSASEINEWLAEVVGESADPEIRWAGIVLSARELAHQSAVRAALGVAYGAPPVEHVQRRLRRVASAAAEAFRLMTRRRHGSNSSRR